MPCPPASLLSDPTPATVAAARELVRRRLSGQAGPRLPDDVRPGDLAQAMRIQMACVPLMGDTIGGWKCGTPGPDKLVAAPIYTRSIHRDAGLPCLAWATEDQVLVEPELAFVLGQDLPVRAAPYTPAEVDAALGATHLALELIFNRYREPPALGFADKLADGLVNQGLCLGPAVDAEAARLTQAMPIVVHGQGGLRDGWLDGSVSEALQVRAGQHPDGQPRLPLYWLAEYLRAQGIGLRAGQVVITGSYAGSFGLPLGRDIGLRFGELGAWRVRFERRLPAA